MPDESRTLLCLHNRRLGSALRKDVEPLERPGGRRGEAGPRPLASARETEHPTANSQYPTSKGEDISVGRWLLGVPRRRVVTSGHLVPPRRDRRGDPNRTGRAAPGTQRRPAQIKPDPRDGLQPRVIRTIFFVRYGLFNRLWLRPTAALGETCLSVTLPAGPCPRAEASPAAASSMSGRVSRHGRPAGCAAF